MASVLTPNEATNGRTYETVQRPHILETLFPNNVVMQIPAKGTGSIPSNLVETWGSYFLQIAVPGVDAGTLTVQVVARRVTVRGKYAIPRIENGSFVWHDIPSGEFCDMFELPAEVDGDAAHARYEHGVLTVELPKIAYLKPASIVVEAVD